MAEVSTGVDALSAAREHRPDLIVLDIGIPKMDGLMVISGCAPTGATYKPGIVVLTAQNPDHLAARCLHAGASGFVYKRQGAAGTGQAPRRRCCRATRTSPPWPRIPVANAARR